PPGERTEPGGRCRLRDPCDRLPGGRLGGPAAGGLAAAGRGTPRSMRLSVLDVGSNTVRLEMSDGEAGVRLPVHTAKWKLRLHDRTGLSLRVLPGEVEARLTFLGARRWMGWRSGPLSLFDIGGGSLEVAFGRGRVPEFAVSLPLGANRLTKEFLHSADPPR